MKKTFAHIATLACIIFPAVESIAEEVNWTSSQDFSTHTSELLGLTNTHITILENQEEVNKEWEDVISLQLAAYEFKAGGYALLVDGQRLYGEILGYTEEAIQFRMRGEEVFISLDNLVAYVDSDKADIQTYLQTSEGRDDVLLFADGTRLEGFLEGFNSEANTIIMQLSATGESLELPTNNVAVIQLSATIEPNVAADEWWLETIQGEKLRITEMALENNRVTFEVAGLNETSMNIAMHLNQVSSLYQSNQRYGILGLDALELEFAMGEIFGIAWPEQIVGHTIHTHAPCMIRLLFPTGAKRFTTTIGLDIASMTQEQKEFAHCVVTIEVGGHSESHTLTAENTTIEIDLDVERLLDLRINIEEGRNGPLLDRVFVHKPQVFIDHGS